ncbi:unnamed protein product [Prunus armeniaca]
MAEEGLEFEYRKKLQGIEFWDMHDLINKVDRYASLLKEEVQKRTASKGTYYRNPVVSYAEADSPTEAESDEVEMSSAEVSIDKPFVCKGLVKADNSRTKIPDAKFATREMKAYTFDLTRAEAIFDLLLTEKKVKLSFGHKILKPEVLKGKTFCKWHSSWFHNTNNFVVLRDVIQKLIDEKKLQFPEKAAMQVDSKPFPPPVINMVNAQLWAEYREVHRSAEGKEPLVPCTAWGQHRTADKNPAEKDAEASSVGQDTDGPGEGVKTPKEDGDCRRTTIHANRSPCSEGCQHQASKDVAP